MQLARTVKTAVANLIPPLSVCTTLPARSQLHSLGILAGSLHLTGHGEVIQPHAGFLCFIHRSGATLAHKLITYVMVAAVKRAHVVRGTLDLGREESVYFIQLTIVLANKTIISLCYQGIHGIFASSISNTPVWNIRIDNRIANIQKRCHGSISVFMILVIHRREEESRHLRTASSVRLVVKRIEILFFPGIVPFFIACLVLPIVFFLPIKIIKILTSLSIYENGRVCLMIHHPRLAVLVNYF